MRRRFFIIYNPIAGRRRCDRLQAVTAALRVEGAEVALVETAAPGHATDLARALWDGGDFTDRPDAVVAAGGDGTISEVARGLIGGDLALGVVPLGTANVLAQDLGIMRHGWDAGYIARSLMAGMARPMAVGRLRQGGEARPFVMMVGAGFDAAAVAAINPDLKKRIGPGAYVWAGAQALFAGRRGLIRLVQGDRAVEANWVIITNGRHYGGPYVLDRAASIFAPQLVAIAVKAANPLALIWKLIRLGAGSLAGAPGVTRWEGDQFAIEPIGKLVIPVQCDGDPAGVLPAQIGLYDQPVQLITPL